MRYFLQTHLACKYSEIGRKIPQRTEVLLPSFSCVHSTLIVPVRNNEVKLLYTKEGTAIVLCMHKIEERHPNSAMGPFVKVHIVAAL